MEAKVINKTELTYLDIVKGNILSHRFLSIFYLFMCIFFIGYTIANFDLLILNLQALILGTALILLSAWVCILWPLLRALIWLIRLKKKHHTNKQVLDIQFFDLYLKVDNETQDNYYKLEYKDIYKVIITKKLMILLFGRNEFMYIKISGFKKANDLDKVKSYLARQGLIKKK